MNVPENLPKFDSKKGLIAPVVGKAPGPEELVAGCKSNLNFYGTALEMYRTDHGGKYPESLSQLFGVVLMSVRVCPTAKRDTYSGSYRAPGGTSFRMYCQGDYHKAAGVRPNLPAHDSKNGLSW